MACLRCARVIANLVVSQQKLLRPIHREIFLKAKCASDVYTSNICNNQLVLDTTMDAEGLTAAGANAFLHESV